MCGACTSGLSSTGQSPDWTRAYPRDLGAYPVESVRAAKYWPPVGRIDGAYGDRNVVCSCPDIDAYR